jgi:15-cis-phytoene synthase
MQGAVQDAYRHCEALGRASDKERYRAGLRAPVPKRQHLYALAAWAVEIARVSEAVRTPLVGEIRLQWWRDALSGEGEAACNPVAAALLDTFGRCSALPREALL